MCMNTNTCSILFTFTGDSASQYYFTVGSIDSFERKLEQSQYDLGLEQKDFVAVVYSNETSWGIGEYTHEQKHTNTHTDKHAWCT